MRTSRTRIALGFLIAALVTGAAATWGIVSILGGYEVIEAQRPPVRTMPVVLAARTLHPGVALGTDDLRVVRFPIDLLPIEAGADGELAAAEVFGSLEAVIGRVPRERIYTNEAVRPERLAHGELGLGINGLIPRGLRAVSLGLSGADAVAGFLGPGSVVDVLVTRKDASGLRQTSTLHQAVVVLAVNGRAEGERAEDALARGASAPSVTFLVTPRQAEDLALADEVGDVSLTLRNPRDFDVQRLAAVDLSAILPPFAPLPPARLPFRPRVPVEVVDVPRTPAHREGIVVIRGPHRTEVPLEAGLIPW